MTNEFLQAAYKERNRLKEALLHLPIYKQLQAIEKFIADYNDGNSQVRFDFSKTIKAKAPEITTKREKIIKFSKEYIVMSGGNANFRKIREHLLSNGVDVTEAALSAYLSAEKDIFVPDRVKGWGLKTPQTNTVAVEAATVV